MQAAPDIRSQHRRRIIVLAALTVVIASALLLLQFGLDPSPDGISALDDVLMTVNAGGELTNEQESLADAARVLPGYDQYRGSDPDLLLPCRSGAGPRVACDDEADDASLATRAPRP